MLQDPYNHKTPLFQFSSLIQLLSQFSLLKVSKENQLELKQGFLSIILPLVSSSYLLLIFRNINIKSITEPLFLIQFNQFYFSQNNIRIKSYQQIFLQLLNLRYLLLPIKVYIEYSQNLYIQPYIFALKQQFQFSLQTHSINSNFILHSQIKIDKFRNILINNHCNSQNEVGSFFEIEQQFCKQYLTFAIHGLLQKLNTNNLYR
ncbi:unnamed protein product (macronuclear) [Paramecium tetraurelia]|uniref:Transmembrane protein n=1 Tax=Paramecium tetraurelia TaxID=5888 RepID=A0DN22_PARTE|nr:uncharacterized protein GSPATT00018644001 [Paramecium tetraurelia]CAK84439.1 unnamed protein product [Paramecium tetraurelia]|eukprot:XP_001451836.1 hypothetical protein (macronuclear) [Paramecium tetraurelia strain d4-2]